MPGLVAVTRPDELLAEFDRKYMWWRAVDGGSHSPERVIAQVMNLGTYDDIRRLERQFSPGQLGDIMRGGAAGWFTPRSWELWRGRLSVKGIDVADSPPLRSFYDAET